MKAEKKYYIGIYEQQLSISSDDERKKQLKYDINRLKIGLNKISQHETGVDAYEIENDVDSEYAKKVYDTAIADNAERKKLQSLVKEGNLTKEDLQELINSLSKRV